jgi:hypothetical protein
MSPTNHLDNVQMSPPLGTGGKRWQHSLTQDQFSARLARRGVQIDRAGVAKIENGLRRVYDFEIPAIAKTLKTTPSQLLRF